MEGDQGIDHTTDQAGNGAVGDSGHGDIGVVGRAALSLGSAVIASRRRKTRKVAA